MNDIITGLRVELGTLRSALRKIEWVAITGKVMICPYCKRNEKTGHTKTCALDEAVNGQHKDAGKFWLTGRVRGISAPGPLWEIIGIFVNESMADLACISNNHFMLPIPLNGPLIHAVEPVPGAPEIRFPRTG